MPVQSSASANMDEQTEQRLELKRDFTEFLDSDWGRQTGKGKYVEAIADIMKAYPTTKVVRLDVDMQGKEGVAGGLRWMAMARITDGKA